MGRRATIKANASDIVGEQLNRQLPPHGFYSLQQMFWLTLIRNIQGGKFDVIDNIIGGVKNCTYIYLFDLFDLEGIHIKANIYRVNSRVAAIPNELIEKFEDTDKFIPTPIEPRQLTGAGAWWKQPEHNLDVVRLVTSWVDGFMAFTPHQE